MKRAWLPHGGRVALLVHAAVVHVDVVDGPGVQRVVGVVVEDDDFEVRVHVTGDRALVADDPVEVRVLVDEAGAGGGQLSGGHVLGADLQARGARVLDRQDRGEDAVAQVADGVGRAVAPVVLARVPAQVHGDRRGGADVRVAVDQVLQQRPDPVLELGDVEGVAEEAADVADDVQAVQLRAVARDEAGPGVEDGGVGLEGGPPAAVVVPGLEAVLDDPLDVLHGEVHLARPGAVVAAEHPLDDSRRTGPPRGCCRSA